MKGRIEIRIFDLMGKLILETSNSVNVSSNQSVQVDLSSIESGNYLLSISNGKEHVTKTLIISK